VGIRVALRQAAMIAASPLGGVVVGARPMAGTDCRNREGAPGGIHVTLEVVKV